MSLPCLFSSLSFQSRSLLIRHSPRSAYPRPSTIAQAQARITYCHRHLVIVAAHDNNNNNNNRTANMDTKDDGQVKIHPKKTEAELEQEKWQEAHRLACEGNCKSYIDPKTGYTVMTELLHKRRGYCCGNTCRHCPFDKENVGVSPEVKKANIQKGKQRRIELEAKEGKFVWADEVESDDDPYYDTSV